MAVLSATYFCEGCENEADGTWPGEDEGDEQDRDGAPVAEQECVCGHRQLVAYPGYSFQQEV